MGWEDFTTEEALLDLSPRLLEAPASGAAAGKSIAPHLERMVEEYYQLMGWDPATARPRPETLNRLGLETYAG